MNYGTRNISQLLLMAATMMVMTMMMQNSIVTGFSVSSSISSCHRSSLSTSTSFQSRLGASISDDEEDDKEREFARVRRRRGRSAYADDDDDIYDEDSSSSSSSSRSVVDDSSVMDAANLLEDKGFFDDLDDDEYDDDDDVENDESYDMFSNTLIPNPILDSIDPEGSADRFEELASDPKFWFDLFLFLAFINFVSYIGPRNMDSIPAIYTAGLPPPGM